MTVLGPHTEGSPEHVASATSDRVSAALAMLVAVGFGVFQLSRPLTGAPFFDLLRVLGAAFGVLLALSLAWQRSVIAGDASAVARAIEYYRAHPEHRHELGTVSAQARFHENSLARFGRSN